MEIGTPTAGHFIYIPVVLLLGIVIGWVLGSRAAADAMAMEKAPAEKNGAKRTPAADTAASGLVDYRADHQALRQRLGQPRFANPRLGALDRVGHPVDLDGLQLGVVDREARPRIPIARLSYRSRVDQVMAPADAHRERPSRVGGLQR